MKHPSQVASSRWLVALGVVFCAFAALQAVALLWGGLDDRGLPFVLLSAAFAAAYGTAGWRLLSGRLGPRWPVLVLSLLAFLAFPLGTVAGAFGLWTLFATRAREASRQLRPPRGTRPLRT